VTAGVVTDIQRFSLDDGPGIRTTVFLKGCGLRCAWCHNPETWSPRRQLMRGPACRGCGACASVVPAGDAACLERCPTGALDVAGAVMRVDEVLAEVLEDRDFYGADGGVTLSGGEPVRQHAFAAALLAACRRAGVHTAIETGLAYPWARLAALLPALDLVIFDIKLWDAARHRRYTGRTNRQILANARRLGETGIPLIARTPVIAGINDCPREIAAIAEFLRQLPNLIGYELLPCHPLGADKYRALGLAPPAFDAPPPARMAELRAAARRDRHDL